MARTKTYKDIVEQTKKLVAEQRQDLLQRYQDPEETVTDAYTQEEERYMMEQAEKLKQTGGLAAAREAISLVQKHKDNGSHQGRELCVAFVKNLSVKY